MNSSRTSRNRKASGKVRGSFPFGSSFAHVAR
jgi:hypothetical protein